MIGSHSQFGGLRANIRLMFQAMVTRLLIPNITVFV